MSDLNSILTALEIRSFQDQEGNYTVLSQSEPAFCYVRTSEEELRVLVAETLKSYAKIFHQTDIDVQITSEEVAPPRMVKLEQRSRFLPTFGTGSHYGNLVTA